LRPTHRPRKSTHRGAAQEAFMAASYDLLVMVFDLEELHTLAFDLGVD
jgi:hypothetical protein